MQGRREQALHKYPTAGGAGPLTPVIPVLGPGTRRPLKPTPTAGQAGQVEPAGGGENLPGAGGRARRVRDGAPAGTRGGPGCPGGREGVPRAAAHLVLQDADVALQEAGPDGQSRVALAALRRAAGHRRHLLLPPPRLRAAPADADAAVHEQQAGAHGGECQADGQPVALRGAQREPAQRAPPAAGPAGRAASPPAHPQVSPIDTRHKCEERTGEAPPSSYSCPSPARSRASLLFPSPAASPLVPSVRPATPRLSCPCRRPPLGIAFGHFNECWGL